MKERETELDWNAYGEVSKKLMPDWKARRTEALACSSETEPKTLPRGDAPNPTLLSFSPVLPSSRNSILSLSPPLLLLLSWVSHLGFMI